MAVWGEGAGTELSIADLACPQVGCLRIVEEFALDVFTLMRVRRTDQYLGYADLLQSAERKDFGAGVVVVYASIAHLLDLKAGTGRSKDASDIAILSEIARDVREKTSIDLTTVEPAASAEGPEQGDWPLPVQGGRPLMRLTAGSDGLLSKNHLFP